MTVGVRGDYRRLNAQTLPDRYPIAYVQDFALILHGKTIFSTIDLTRAYDQIPVADEDIPKRAVTTPLGLFEFMVMPFGLRNAVQTFQHFIKFSQGSISFSSTSTIFSSLLHYPKNTDNI